MAVVFISAELEEVLRLSDRLVVMRDRRKIDERPNDDVSVSDVLEIIAGEARDGGGPPMPEAATTPQPRPWRASPLLWPVLALVALLVVNVIATPSFLDIRMQDGHLYGNLIDILRNSAPVLLVALGMTLVIATRGIDLSVGAIAAIAGAVACTRIVGARRRGRRRRRRSWRARYGPRRSASCSALWNGFLVSVLGIQPIIATLVLMVAGRGLAMLDHRRPDHHRQQRRSSATSASGFVLTLPVAILVALAMFALTALLTRRTALGMLIEAVGINPEASRLAGVRARTIIWTVYVFSGLCAGIAGLMIAANTNSVERQQRSGCGSSSTRSSPSSSAARRWPAAGSP